MGVRLRQIGARSHSSSCSKLHACSPSCSSAAAPAASALLLLPPAPHFFVAALLLLIARRWLVAALVGQDIDWSVDTLRAIFDVHVAFRDPGIVPSFGGMFNALLGFGDTFLEIVSPTDKGYELDSTSAKMLRKMGGDCGYMCIFGVDDIAYTSDRVSKLGRVATSFGTQPAPRACLRHYLHWLHCCSAKPQHATHSNPRLGLNAQAMKWAPSFRSQRESRPAPSSSGTRRTSAR
jgi:hypothetical protein